MNGFFEGLLSNRPLVVAVSVLVILAYIVIRWRRAGRYVEDRNKLYSEHYKKVFEYSDRVRSDQRWPGFLAMIQERHPVVDTGEPSDEETYQVYYRSIWDAGGAQYEPNQAEPGVSGISAFLKRKAKPRFIMVQVSPTGEFTEEKVSGASWYDMFEKSV
jgi:hypothetical protein